MNPLRTLKRMFRNSDATVQRLHAVEAAISDQSDMLSRKLDILIGIMNELREVQKGQLTMQRSAAEAIKRSANPNS